MGMALSEAGNEPGDHFRAIIGAAALAGGGDGNDDDTFRRRAAYPIGWRRVAVTLAGRDLVHASTSEGPRAVVSLEPRSVRHCPPGNDA